MPLDELLRVPFVVGAGLAVAGVVWLLRSMASREVQQRLRERAVGPITAAPGGGMVTIEGRAFPLTGAVTPPISKRPAVLFRTRVHRLRHRESPVLVHACDHNVPWLVQDAAGTTAIVESADARLVLRQVAAVGSQGAPMYIENWLRSHGYELRNRFGVQLQHSYSEEVLAVGEPVCISGVASARDDGTIVIQRPQLGWMLVLSGTVSAYLDRFWRLRRLGLAMLLAGGLTAAVAGGAIVFAKEIRIAMR